MKIKRFDQFQINEEMRKKDIVAGAIGLGALGLGVSVGGGYLRDKTSAPTEAVSTQYKSIPDNFMLNKKVLSLRHEFWITDEQRANYGKIVQKFSLLKKFELFDSRGQLVATARVEPFSFYNLTEITDASGNYIGKIEEEIIESIKNISELKNVYSIYNSQNQLVGKSERNMIIGNKVEISDMKGNSVAYFKKPAISLSDRWSCEVYTNKIDKRLLVFIPAFISASGGSSSSKSKNK